ncbi:MAG: RdgB/HAM1 family non-canonical purine NTP pyrophosphatase [Rhodothermaceae bacterium]|nr:RdgB/HAM1 family non-canonical purine NTP pyrophosphatase [Rhodothermaceae bacterium]
MHQEKKLVLATGNEGKKKEIEYLLRGFDLEIYSLRDFDGLPEVDEDQPTLEGNAEKKARVIHELLGIPTLADDTGLEVDALDGRPGVYSARYAGEDGNADANRALLLKEMADKKNRAARFRTVLAYFINGEKHLFQGVCEGEIIGRERGIGGFGYDPVFLPENSEMTFAEMSVEEKNKISHRGKALREFVHHLSKK